jgi:hypothetical protein
VATFLHSIESNVVPECWLKTFFSETISDVPIDTWIGQLKERRNMLGAWLTLKHSDFVKLHLLQNPVGIFHAIREAVSEKARIPVETVSIDIHIIDIPHNPAERSAMMAKIHSQNGSALLPTYTIIVSGAVLLNGRYAADKCTVEFMHPATASRTSQASFPLSFPPPYFPPLPKITSIHNSMIILSLLLYSSSCIC